MPTTTPTDDFGTLDNPGPAMEKLLARFTEYGVIADNNHDLTSLAASIVEARANYERLANEVGRLLPPLTVREVCDRVGQHEDHALKSDVERFLHSRFSGIDVTLLDRGVESWERLNPTERSADEKNQEEDESLHGFPFAWNHGYVWNDKQLPSDWQDALTQAGYLVYRYVGASGDDSEIICGIDGAGYSFYEAHHAKLYAILAARFDWTVETSEGPRRVVR